MSEPIRRVLLFFVLAGLMASTARAERLCDPASEDCRAALIQLIRAEQTGIDVAFWFMEDGRYANELIARARAGVPVRVLMDRRANAEHPVNAQLVAQLAAAGIPMRRREGGGILHWKMMLFAGQQTVEFSGANYSPDALVPADPYRNYVDEAIYFSDDLAIVHSFMRRFDDSWIDQESYRNEANITGTPARRYAVYPLDKDLNFVPLHNYRSKSLSAFGAETQGIDAIMYRVTDRAYTDALIAAMQRGVHVRLVTEQAQYRDPTRLWHSWNIDRLYMAGVEVRERAHLGLNHQKSVILRGQAQTIFGSSNWTAPSADRQEEHNYFTRKGWIFAWFQQQFDRKWNNLGPAPETQPFTPLPPGRPVSVAPAYNSSGVPVETTLVFHAGPFAHLYDIYFGTTPDPPLLAAAVELGPTEPNGAPRQYQLPSLAPSTTYYWRIVARTMAQQVHSGDTWLFTTGAAAPQPTPAPTPPSPPPPPPTPPPSVPPRPAMVIDTPANSAVVKQPFMIAGWALDAAASTGAGVDVVHVYAYPNPGSGTPPLFIGASTTAVARPDVAAAFGPQFATSGYGLLVHGLAPGPYMLVAYGRSLVAGTFAIAKSVRVQVQPSTTIVLDVPRTGDTVTPTFQLAGWAIDSSAASGGGVDIVHAWAYRLDAAAAPLFLGQGSVNMSRPDVGAAFGSQFSEAGFSFLARDVPPGRYQVVVYARSLVVGTFAAAASVNIVVTR
ncbi:MAG TPA: phosphatidylserine/phosphatidylglycerophosphate/cardiolipin synthase family protein [Vicinamibacterales bacterium]|nr:phosphatidylserine/phosphatidylglycerophosphate/cardiolipin synthase family protein [Vicinamibacterales bacterium]